MARVLTATLEAAIEANATYRALVKATLEPSRIFFTAITDNNPFAGAEADGIIDSPIPQAVGYSPALDALVTFVNDGGTLKYSVQGSSSLTSLSLSITGNPSVVGDTLYRISGGSVFRHAINWSGPSLGGGTNIGTPAEGPLAVHGASATRCAVICDGDGGLRVYVYDNTTEYVHPHRFMFPKMIDYTDGGVERPLSDLALFSGGLELDGRVYCYISNNVTGSVDAVFWSEVSTAFSDIYTAVPSDIDMGLCEFRAVNAYAHNGTAYLCGQFQRTEELEGKKVYSMILSSVDGRYFSMDPFTSVSYLGYRFHAAVGNARLYLGHCNRVCFSDITYVFNGVEGIDHLSLDIPDTKIVTFIDQSLARATIELTDSDDFYLTHPYVKEQNRIIAQVGAMTTSGSAGEFVEYGRYIIEEVDETIANGKRGITLNVAHESQWKLTNLSSPFYTELFSRSAIFDELVPEVGNLYTAPEQAQATSLLVVDLWQTEPFSVEGLVGLMAHEGGGVNVTNTTGVHLWGAKTKELRNILPIIDNPTITSGSVGARLYGWSWGDPDNDMVELLLVSVDEDDNETVHTTSGSSGWDNTYPSYSAGNEPIDLTITGLPVGEKIKAVGMTFQADNDTHFCPARIELYSGFTAAYLYDDPNTPWTAHAGSYLLLPGFFRPYLMFSQKPYNATNFQIRTSFYNTITSGSCGNAEDYPIGGGVVGMAQNGMNYVLGRWNDRLQLWEIVLVRGGFERVLASGAGTVAPLDQGTQTRIDVQFEHRDGDFVVYSFDAPTDTWTPQISYMWVATDGWMFTSKTETKKTGIWGAVMTPSFKITSRDNNVQDEKINSDGIPMLPGEDITNFPATGEAMIEDSVYEYTSKIDPPSPYIRGPFQFRQNGDYGGLECRDFGGVTSGSSGVGKLVAMDDGGNWIITEVDMDAQDLHDRARYLSTNEQIFNTFHGLQNRVWVTGGLAGLTKTTGETLTHRIRKICGMKTSGHLRCSWFVGVSGSEDTSVKDLIERLSQFSGARAIFPGDVVFDSFPVSGKTEVAEKLHVEGFDLRFRVASSATVTVESKGKMTRIVWRRPTDNSFKIEIEHQGGGVFRVSLYGMPSGDLMEGYSFTAPTGAHEYRIIAHEDNITVYMDGTWIDTFCTGGINWPKTTQIYLNGSFTALDLRLTDLNDWREAIYMDLETNGLTAVRDVIQERPVEIYPRSDGSIGYWYDYDRETVIEVIPPRNWNRSKSAPVEAASDAIIYAADRVLVIQFDDFHKEHGFSTKVFRFPNLDVGASRAAQIFLQRLFEGRRRHEVAIRPNMKLEIGDIISVSETLTSTGTLEEADVIIEGIGLNVTSKNSAMLVRGREVYP